jgi:predicted AlkP superfamily pyrophosphatase or phosphodiesterase
MKDLAGQRIEIPQFRHYITEYFPEALGSFGASRGHLIKNEYDKCILFILDAFGFETMSKLGVLAGLNMRVEEFGSVVPSVTPSALASISTGELPAKHGIIGKEFWVPKAGCGVDAFSLTDASTGIDVDLKSEELLLSPPLTVQAQEDGIKSWSIYPNIYGNSFSDAIYKGTTHYPSSGLGGFYDSLFKFIHSKDPLAIAHWPNPTTGR